mgnify:CR=1 FL=1
MSVRNVPRSLGVNERKDTILKKAQIIIGTDRGTLEIQGKINSSLYLDGSISITTRELTISVKKPRTLIIQLAITEGQLDNSKNTLSEICYSINSSNFGFTCNVEGDSASYFDMSFGPEELSII